MSHLVDSICLLNSSYSKDKIIKILKKRLSIVGVHKYILLSSIIQTATVNTLNNATEISLKCGNYMVVFKYDSSECSISDDDLKCLLASFVVSIENSVIYNDLTNKITFSEGKSYPTFNTLVEDISKEIEQYKRHGTDFCVAKIGIENEILGEKFNYKLKKYLDIVKDSVRITDSVYRDIKNIYILFRNVGINDGVNLVSKLKDAIPNSEIGIAEWRSSYAIVDLFTEIDNFIYLSKVDIQSQNICIKEELNKILNKAILYNELILIVNSLDVKPKHEKYISFNFTIDGVDYTVLRKYKKKDDFTNAYEFNFEDIAEDIFEILQNNN